MERSLLTVQRQEDATQAFQPHELEWSPEHVRRFWSVIGRSPHAVDAYFSSHSGDALIDFVSRHVALTSRQRLLDWGCGPGFLLHKLCARGFHARGLEFSADSMHQAIDRCKEAPTFGGVTLVDAVPTSLDAATFDVVFLIEVIEHLLPEHVDTTLAEIHRLLKPGGAVVVSTPHNENLAAAQTVCPDCGLVFHPWQHVGSFTVPSLAHRMLRHRFDQVYCGATTIGAVTPLILRTVRRVLRRRTAEPHLIYIGRRS